MILVHLLALYNIDLEILTKPHYNDLSDYVYAIKYYAIMIRSSVLRRISHNVTINVHRVSPFKHDYRKQ